MHLRNNKRYLPSSSLPRKRRKIASPEDAATAKQASHHNSQFIFFTRLPREFRDNIYEYAFGPEDISFHYRKLIIVTYARQLTSYDTHMSGLPRWILMCKVVLEEAMETFYRTRTYAHACYSITLTYTTAAWTSGLRRPKQFRGNPTRVKSAYKNSLLFNKKIRNVDIVGKIRIGGEPETPSFGLYFVDKIFAGYLEKLKVQDVALICDGWLTFDHKVVVSQTTEGRNRKPRPANDLDMLRGHCRSVSVVLQGCGCKGRNCYRCGRRWGILLDMAYGSTKNWAKDIIAGEGGVMEVGVQEQRDSLNLRSTIKVLKKKVPDSLSKNQG
jgi:hypothetical protein